MLVITRLDIKRQVVVGNALRESIASDRPTPILPTTLTRADLVLARTAEVSLFAGFRPAKVDRSCDSVTTCFKHVLDYQEGALLDSVVAHGEPQRRALGWVRRVRARLFPQGTGFIKSSMDVQWSELVALRTRMQEPEVMLAIDGLALRPFVDHLLAHIELYGRILGKDAGNSGAGEEEASAAWTEAFKLFNAQVMLDYNGNPAMQHELLGPYVAQLEQQRALARAASKQPTPKKTARKAARLAATKVAPTPAPAPAAVAPADVAPAKVTPADVAPVTVVPGKAAPAEVAPAVA